MFEHFASEQLLRDEVERDVEHGLLTKTVIHPGQIAIVEAAYAVGREELAEAEPSSRRTAPPSSPSPASMCEPTHQRWAQTIVRRAEIFGLKREAGTIAMVDA